MRYRQFGFNKYVQDILQALKYFLWGLTASAVNVGVYAALTRLLSMQIAPASASAWLAANLYAFFANRTFVFKTGKKKLTALLKECLFFLATRLFSGGMDTLCMYIFAQRLGFYDVAVKIADGAVFGFINYLLGRFIIFKPRIHCGAVSLHSAFAGEQDSALSVKAAADQSME